MIFVGKRMKETQETIRKFGKKIYGKEINVLARIPYIRKINKSVIDQMKNLVKI